MSSSASSHVIERAQANEMERYKGYAPFYVGKVYQEGVTALNDAQNILKANIVIFRTVYDGEAVNALEGSVNVARAVHEEVKAMLEHTNNKPGPLKLVSFHSVGGTQMLEKFRGMSLRARSLLLRESETAEMQYRIMDVNAPPPLLGLGHDATSLRMISESSESGEPRPLQYDPDMPHHEGFVRLEQVAEASANEDGWVTSRAGERMVLDVRPDVLPRVNPTYTRGADALSETDNGVYERRSTFGGETPPQVEDDMPRPAKIDLTTIPPPFYFRPTAELPLVETQTEERTYTMPGGFYAIC